MSTSTVSEMKVVREELNPCTIKLTITCSSDQVKSGFDKTIKSLSKKVKIPGFRPGMAPKKMVEEALNPQAVYEGAAEQIVEKSYKEAIEKESLEPNGYPAIDLTKLERDSGECEYTAKVPLKPVIELVDYKGLKVEKPVVEVTDEEVDKQIDEFRRQSGSKQEVTDRGVKEGDVAVVNIKVDGEEGEGKTFMVVAGQTFDGLDKTITGMGIEDVKAKKLDFPASFQNPAWAGNKLDCQVMVKSISAVQMPELDDDFAKQFDIDSVDEMKNRVREGITKAKNDSVDDMVRSNLLDQLVEKSTVHVADNTWESVVQRKLAEMNRALVGEGKTLEGYIKESGMSEEEFNARLTEEAQVNVRRAVVIQKLFEENKLEIKDQDVNEHFMAIARENNVPAQQLEEFAKQNGQALQEEVVFRTMAAKVTDILLENADVKEVKDGSPKKASASKKAAEKKPATKKTTTKKTTSSKKTDSKK